MTDISGFDQAETRFLYETLERYKLKIKLWPSHNLDDLAEVQYFTKVLYGDTRLLLDAFVEGIMLTKSATYVEILIENMPHNEYHTLFDRWFRRKGNESMDSEYLAS